MKLMLLFFLFITCDVVVASKVDYSSSSSGPVHHFVSFRFTASTSQRMIQKLVSGYMALKDACVDPITNQTYIVNFLGGSPNSVEGFQQQMQVAFVVTFPNVYYRNYFVGRPFTTPYDPHHDAFKTLIAPYLYQPIAEGLIVIDFVDGLFNFTTQTK